MSPGSPPLTLFRKAGAANASGYAFGMATPNRFVAAIMIAALMLQAVPARAAKATKATKAPLSVTFEAHNEGAGDIYGDENLVTVTIGSAGIRCQGKGIDKPLALSWAQVSGWQANRFTSYSVTRATGGDFGIGIYQDARYFSFRTHNGRDYTAAIKALRAYAPAKERAGMG